MKFFTVLILNLVFYSTSICQPKLNSVALPEGVKIPFSFGAATNPGAAGENVTWDFSNHPLNNAGVFERVDPSTTPYYDSFPNSNYVFKITTSTLTFYNYYNLTSTAFDWVGVRYNSNGTGINLKQAPYTFVTFPFNYKDSIVDTYKSADNSINEVETRVYDGYGTLITPFATYKNAVRIKSTSSLNDVTYDWYVADQNFFTYSIFQISVAGNSSRVFNYNISTSVNEITTGTNAVQVYPNPASKTITIDCEHENCTLTIYDLSGRKIKEQTITSTQKTVDVSALAKGLYTYQVHKKDNLLKNGKVVISH